MIELPGGECAGFFKLEAVKPDGSRRLLADWFPNLITDAGLNLMATSSSYLNYVQVGTGSVTPVETDTGLTTWLAGKQISGGVLGDAATYGNASSAPYYGYIRVPYRFSAGTATGNLTEIGIADGTAASANLFSHALILDGLGNPTTVTVLADEALDVTYELRMYPPAADAVQIVTIGADDYTATVRAANVTSKGEGFAQYYGWAYSLGNKMAADNNGIKLSMAAYSGAIGAVTGQPSGTAASIFSSSGYAAYVNNSYSGVVRDTFGLTEGNVTGGMSSLLIVCRGGEYQIGFSPPVPKTGSNNLYVSFKYTWARRTL